MFYSQFILAKKGPLGTIWIAAHLERKLRKNQVADTDIPFSVDSILFPDLPIALRLSSHLLLGVVRIYSRKVNYLFDDCSEALLKIKQAFRSTAVDLPPEESTAPYHSITLPETFDLDDFELADGEIFQGNYVDHHVSTKEQITLQDPMDGVVYSTSKFGLDERFGDGDTSQVALDLEEDMFLDKVTARPEEILEANAGTSGAAPPQLTESSAPLPLEGMAVDLEAGDYAQAPSTPGLVNEPNLSSVQERLASEDHLESDDHNLTESVGTNGRDNTSFKLDLHCMDDETGFSPYNLANDDPMGAMTTVTEEAEVEVNKENVKGKSFADRLAIDDAEDQNKTASNNEQGEPIDGKCEEYLEVTLHDFKDSGVDIEGREGHGLDFGPVTQAGIEPEDPDTLNNHNKDEQIRSSSISMLRACSSLSVIPLEDGPRTLEKDEELGKDEPCTLEKDEERDSFESVKIIQGHVDTDDGQVEKIQLVEPDSTMPSDKLDGSMTSELSAPERLLSAPQMALDMPVSLLIESTPDKEDQEDADGSSAVDKVSAKKRSFVDSMEPMQSTNTAETFNMTKSRRTANSIPDDDDLLSSILAGVRSSALKIKPSPAPLDVSKKRVRSISRASAMKRKVLVDDSMVLLGDIIRQQLTNTEDIRRLRKKAPCTRTEIVIIQRQFLEEEIFSDPVLTGMALGLTHLHCEKLDLSRIEVTINDGNTGLLETGQGNEFSPRPPLTEDNSVQGDPESSNSKDVSDKQCKELPVQGANQQGEGHQLQSEDVDHHRDSIGIGVILDAGASEVEPLGEVTDMEFDQANNSLLLGEQASGSPLGSRNEPALLDKTAGEDVYLAVETAVMPCDEKGIQSNRNDPSVSSTINGENVDGVNILGNCTDNLTITAADLGEDEESLVWSEADKLVKMTADIQINGNALTDDGGPAFFNVLSEKEGCINADSLNVAEAPEHESDKRGVNEGGVTVSPGCDDKDHFSAYSQSEDCRLSTGPYLDIKDGSFHEIDYVVGCETDQQSAMDTGHPFISHYTEGHFLEPQDISFTNDTGFLNVDDNDLAEDDDDIPGADNAQLFDNSGWSSRTRAVGNFLQRLFDKEAEHGRKFLSVDRLLIGKTRKEASRMFFETLVLKTKDYIHVEQENPFENINIKARAKLMKSEF